MGDVEYHRVNQDDPEAASGGFLVKIKSTTSNKDFDVFIAETALVEELQNDLFKRLELDGQGKKIRLIASGKLLDPPTKTLKDFNLKKGDFIHAVISNVTTVQHIPSIPTSSGSATQTPTNRRGLNRLLNEGLSADEVTAVRLSFRDSLDDMEETVPINPEEDPADYQLRVEEAWMSAQGSNSEFRSNFPNLGNGGDNMDAAARQWAAMSRGYASAEDEAEIGSYREFMWGFIMGSLLGFVTIFCVWDRNVSHRQKIGILFGIIFQMLIGAVQSDSTTSHPRTSSSTSSSSESQLRGPSAGTSIDAGAYSVVGAGAKGSG
jgi:hypothetical protein